MAPPDFSTENRKNKHLSTYERGQIAAYWKEGWSFRAMGRALGRASSTIKREVDRGSVDQRDTTWKRSKTYFPDTGQRVYEENRQRCGRKRHHLVEKAGSFLAWATTQMLQEKWSPDVCVGRARQQGGWEHAAIPSTRTLYTYIDAGLLDVKNIDLALKVRRSAKKQGGRQHQKVLGPSIDERDPEVETRETAGHWEIDTVRGTRSRDEALLTLVERATRQVLVRRLPEPTAAAVNEALNGVWTAYGEEVPTIFQTMTADNGSEFSELHAWSQTREVSVYFAHPYASYERGTNERHNGLLRRWIKKGQAIWKVTDETITRAEQALNQLPRKILGYQTPQEAFDIAFPGAG